MKPNLFEDQSMTEEQLKDNLESISFKVEENYTFQRPFSIEEVKDKRENLSNISMEIDEQEEQLRQIVRAKRESIKQLKKELRKIIVDVRAQAETVTETVYLIDDQEEGQMGYYDKNGVFISSRKLLPNERNLRIDFSNRKAL